MKNCKKRYAAKIVAIATILFVAVGVLCVKNSISYATTTHTREEAISWCKSQVGKSLDYDGVYGAQCVDLIKYYYVYLGASQPFGNGKDYATNALPSGWQRVQGGTPQKGDILVYSGNDSNPAGHVAIYESDYSTYHQNFNGVSSVQNITAYRYNGLSNPYWGYIRPDWNTHTHSYSSSVTKQPTCTDKGVRKFTCSCGNSYTEEIAAKGHSYKNTVVAPTTTEKGYTLHVCSACNNSYKDSYVDIPVLKDDGWYHCAAVPSDITSDKYTIQYNNYYEKIQKDSPGEGWTKASTVKDTWENSGAQYESEAELPTSDSRVLVRSFYYHFCGPNAGNVGNYELSGNFVHYDELRVESAIVHSTGMDGTHPYYVLDWIDGGGRIYCQSGVTCDGSYGAHGARCQAWYKKNVYQDRVHVVQYKYTKNSGWVSSKDSSAKSAEVRYKMIESESPTVPDDPEPETPILSGLSAKKIKISYNVGDEISIADVVVTATYSDKTTKNISIKDCETNISKIDTSVAGTKTLTIQYTEKAKTVKTEVNIIIVDKSGSEDEPNPNPSEPGEDNRLQLQFKKEGRYLYFDWNTLDEEAYYDISYSLTEELFPVYEEHNCFEVTNLKADGKTMHYECTNSYYATDIVYFRVRMRKGDKVQYSNAVELVNAATNPENPEETTAQDFLYTINDDGVSVTITKYIAEGTIVKVPETIDGYVVTVIGEKAFENCTSIVSLTLPASIKEIGDYAFSGCTNMKTFSGMTSNLSALGFYAFKNCSSLTAVELNEGRKNIVEGLFSGCTSLSNVKIPDSVQTIQSNAFEGCKSLKEISLPISLKKISENAFLDSGVKTIKYAGTQEMWEERVTVDSKGNKTIEEATKTGGDGTAFDKDKEEEDEKDYTPRKPSLSKLTNEDGGVTLDWSAHGDSDGYYIYRSTNGGSFKMIKTLPWYKTLFTDTTVSNGKTYQYKIASYANQNSKTYVSGQSAVMEIYYLSKPSISSAKSSATKQMTVKWKKNRKATGYEVQYSLKSNFSSKKTVKVKGASKVSATIKNLKKGKTYYVRVRAYKTSGGKKYTSAWSAKKKIKIK